MEDDEQFTSDHSENVDDPGTPLENVNPDEEAVEVPAVKVEPKKKRIVKNPQPKLDADRLRGPRGLIILKDWFKDVRYRGKGHENEDLNAVMLRLEQWTHRLFPKFTFDDTLARIEKLGHKSLVSNYAKRIRLDMVDEEICDRNDNDLREHVDEPSDDMVDPFNALQSQLLNTDNNVISQQEQQPEQSQPIMLTDEQRERMVRNRLLAEERRIAKERLRAEQETSMSQVIQ